MGFGTSKQKSQNTSTQVSESKNQAFPLIQSALTPQVDNAGKGSNAIMNLLGLNGASGQDEGFQRFKDSGGYNFIKDEGIRGITGSNAAKGLLNSGGTLKRTLEFGTNLASNYLDRYLQQLQGVSDSGIKAGQVLVGAGNTANSQGNSFGTSSGSSTNLSLG